MEPLCTTAATRPCATWSGTVVPHAAARPARLRNPRQFGPHTAIWCSWAMVASSSWALTPSGPASPKPLESTTAPPAPLSAAARTVSTTAACGTAMNTASMGSAIASSVGYVRWPKSSGRLGVTR
jgi:hypothetical protein